MTFWWHGPEHVAAAELDACIEKLVACTRQVCVLGAPFGYYPQGAAYGNEYERHLCAIREGMLEQHGFRCEYLGGEDVEGSGVVAVKEVA